MTTTQLTQLITQTESNNSAFEAEINQRDLRACHDGPIGFAAGSTFSELSDTVQAAFPNTLSAHNNKLLTFDPTNPPTATGKRIAVLFSGGPAAGGHNILVGIFNALGTENTLLGVKRGPRGLIESDLFEIDATHIQSITNLGGFDFLGTDRTKIKTVDQFAAVKNTVKTNQLDGIVVVGGDDSNTNAALLAEELSELNCCVIGVPKTIDGDLQVGSHLPISFGFDTATKIYSEMVGNILQDTRSSLKYWHFVKLMGRSASQVTLEVALQTKPAVTLISEEVQEKNMALADIVDQICEVVKKRADQGITHGVVLVPEGLIEFIPEFTPMIQELNDSLAAGSTKLKTPAYQALFDSLPDDIKSQLLQDRDAHGNLQVSLIQTEKLLIDLVKEKLAKESVKFGAHAHFFGYEGRCGTPTLFDAWYCFNLGLIAGSLIRGNHSGYMAALTDLDQGGTPVAIPLAGLITAERRDGKDTLVIEKALVKLDSPAFRYFASRREHWANSDQFSSPGPRQFWGPTAEQLSFTVALNQHYSSYLFKN